MRTRGSFGCLPAMALPLVIVLTTAVPSRAGSIIDNGTVQVGVADLGNLIVPGGPPSGGTGTTDVGLRYMPTGMESISPGCDCEGWGVGDTITQVSGFANGSMGTSNLQLISFSSTGSSATSITEVPGLFQVTHDYFPASETPYLYRCAVTIENISTTDTYVVYRRNMDWDVEPTAYNEYVTIQGSLQATAIVAANDNGFSTSDPLAPPPAPIMASDDFVDSGPWDHGAFFQFDFGILAAGDKFSFTIFYGVAGDELSAVLAVQAVGAEAYSFGQTATSPQNGTPNTFIFAFEGVGGVPLYPCLPPPLPPDLLYTFADSPFESEGAWDVAPFASCGTADWVFVTYPAARQVQRYKRDGHNNVTPLIFPDGNTLFHDGPFGIAVNDLPSHVNRGHVYVTDADGGLAFGWLKVFDTNGCFLADLVVDTSASDPAFVRPTGVAIDEQGDVWVADHGNGSVYRFAAADVATVPPCGIPVGIQLLPIERLDVRSDGYPDPTDVSVDVAGRVQVTYDDFAGNAGVILYDQSGLVIGPPASGSLPMARGIEAKDPFAATWFTDTDHLDHAEWDVMSGAWTPDYLLYDPFWTFTRSGLETERYVTAEIVAFGHDRRFRCRERVFSAGPLEVAVFGRDFLSAPRPAGAQAWFPLDEVTGPLSWNIMTPVHGVWFGFPAPEPARGVVRCGLRFSAGANGLSVASYPGIRADTGSFTIEGWIRAEFDPGIVHILDKRDSTGRGYAMFLQDGYLGVVLDDSSSTSFAPFVSENFVADGTFHHFTMIFSRAVSPYSLRLLVDAFSNSSMVTFLSSLGNLGHNAPLYLGRGSPVAGYNDGFRGELDEITIYDRPLEFGEAMAVACAYCAGKNRPAVKLGNAVIKH